VKWLGEPVVVEEEAPEVAEVIEVPDAGGEVIAQGGLDEFIKST